MKWSPLLYITAFALTLKSAPIDTLHGIGKSEYQSIRSNIVEDQFYHIWVSLPADDEREQKYPTIYLLDGGITFPILAGYRSYLKLSDELPEIIVVGISYGTNDWKEGNNRSTDFTAPAPERDYWGGASKFAEVLEKEIFPGVEEDYPSDPNNRFIFGQSIGGQFAIWCATHHPELFEGFVASNPALHRNLEFFLKPVDANTEQKKPLLYVSSAENDNPRFREPALQWMKHWQSQDETPFNLKTETLPSHNHFSAAPEAFRRGFRWIFQEIED